MNKQEVLIKFSSDEMAEKFMIWLESNYLDSEFDNVDYENNIINTNTNIHQQLEDDE